MEDTSNVRQRPGEVRWHEQRPAPSLSPRIREGTSTSAAVTITAQENRTLVTVREGIDRGEFTRLEAVSTALEVAARTEDDIHAFSRLDAAGARAVAAEQDAMGHPGALSGLPIGIKDLILTAGLPTCAGSATWRSDEPERDAEVVRRIRRAGGVIVGKQRTHEFGYGFDEPVTRSPRDPSLYAGGSTIGGAVSVAVGSSLAAIGTDSGGSIRKPAALNGLVGLKPTWGLIPTDGVVPGVGLCDHVGWITRTVADSCLLLGALTDRAAPPAPAELRGLRVGRVGYYFDRLESATRKAVEAAVERLVSAGAEIVDLDIPELADAPRAHAVLCDVAAVAAHREVPVAVRAGYAPGTTAYLERARAVTPEEVGWAGEQRERIRAAVDRAMAVEGVACMASATLALGPIPLRSFRPIEHLPAYCRLTAPSNLTGHPAVSVPYGEAGGMPFGLQLIGPWHSDPTLLQIAAAVEGMA